MNLFPITFSDEMVKAIRADMKTQTRRVVKPSGRYLSPCPFGKPGDYLYVREEIIAIQRPGGRDKIVGYYADNEPFVDDNDNYVEWPFGPTWLRPREMPMRFARTFLEIIDVRKQELFDITEDECKAEGVPGTWSFGDEETAEDDLHYSTNFQTLWNSINGHRGYDWDTNPVCWAITFKRIEL